MITVDELMKACEHLDSVPTLYKNVAPHNLLRFDGVYKTADCWNYIKSLIWSDCEGAYDRTVGKYWYSNGKYGLYDVTGAEILAQCKNRSKDMSNIQKGEFLYLVYQGGSHAGLYCGNGKVFEFTPIWEDGGQYSGIASDGTRSRNGVKVARWQEHGMLPWVEYPSDYETFEKGDKVIMREGAKVYNTSTNFASWVYSTVLDVVEQNRDRVVVSYEGGIVGAVSANYLVKTDKVTEPIVVEEPPHEEIPVEEDITTIPVDGDSDENLPIWQRFLIDIMYAIAKAISKFYNSK